MIYAACGTHHNIAISSTGEAYSWGYGESWQVGHGPKAGDIEVPTKIDNTATREVKMVTGGAGGQFSVLLGLAGFGKYSFSHRPHHLSCAQLRHNLHWIEALDRSIGLEHWIGALD